MEWRPWNRGGESRYLGAWADQRGDSEGEVMATARLGLGDWVGGGKFLKWESIRERQVLRQ